MMTPVTPDLREPMTHELKCHPPYFREVKAGRKPFEKRKADRPYALGDLLYLREWDPATSDYTGDSLTVGPVTYILGEDDPFGEEGYVTMGYPLPSLLRPPAAPLDAPAEPPWPLVEGIPFDYPAAARSIMLNLSEFLDDAPLPVNLANAARKAAAEVKRLREAAAHPGTAAGVDWWNPGHRLTETELDTAEKTYNDFRRGRLGPITSQRGALEAVIRGFLASQTEAPGTAAPAPVDVMREVMSSLQDLGGDICMEHCDSDTVGGMVHCSWCKQVASIRDYIREARAALQAPAHATDPMKAWEAGMGFFPDHAPSAPEKGAQP